MRIAMALGLLLLTGLAPAKTFAAWPAERALAANGAGVLLGAVATCEQWSEGDSAAASDLFLQWVLREIADPEGQQQLRAAMAKGWKAGSAAARDAVADCAVWFDEYTRVRTALEIKLGQAPASRP